MDFQIVRENALRYLGYRSQTVIDNKPVFEGLTSEISDLLNECMGEIKQIAQPKVVVKKFKIAKDPLRLEESGDEIIGDQMADMLKDCEECLLIGCTLGIAMERKIKFYAKINMTKSTVMDAVASAYLEEYCDKYEETLGINNRTYRACPGYGDFPLEFNRRIAILLDISKKIGVTITPNNLLIPQKSMLGMIGIGSDKRKKSCGNCVMKEDCPFRKRGQRCYRND